MGLQRDLEDRRAKPLLHLTELVPKLQQPPQVRPGGCYGCYVGRCSGRKTSKNTKIGTLKQPKFHENSGWSTRNVAFDQET